MLGLMQGGFVGLFFRLEGGAQENVKVACGKM